MRLTRDSAILWLGALIGVSSYLAQMVIPPWEWTYAQWLSAAGVALGAVSLKLQTSPLPGENDPVKK